MTRERLHPVVQLRPLYRLRFDYPESWAVGVSGGAGKEEQHFLIAEGTAEGRIAGKFRGANAPRRRPDLTFVSAFHGVIECEDGAIVLVEYGGYGRADREPYKTQSPGRRQWVATARHWSEDPKYSWLNDSVCVGTGEVRPKPEPVPPTNPTNLVLDVAELVWEPIPE